MEIYLKSRIHKEWLFAVSKMHCTSLIKYKHITPLKHTSTDWVATLADICMIEFILNEEYWTESNIVWSTKTDMFHLFFYVFIYQHEIIFLKEKKSNILFLIFNLLPSRKTKRKSIRKMYIYKKKTIEIQDIVLVRIIAIYWIQNIAFTLF